MILTTNEGFRLWFFIDVYILYFRRFGQPAGNKNPAKTFNFGTDSSHTLISHSIKIKHSESARYLNTDLLSPREISLYSFLYVSFFVHLSFSVASFFFFFPSYPPFLKIFIFPFSSILHYFFWLPLPPTLVLFKRIGMHARWLASCDRDGCWQNRAS